MLTDALKSDIQRYYRALLKNKGVNARFGQRMMIAEVARTLASIEQDEEGVRTSGAHVCVVEAGTGTGKTVAYMLAALPIARALGKKLVISTATIALQEQIVGKDLPELIKYAGLGFSFLLAKGRSRYLCVSQLKRLLGSETDSPENMALFEDLLVQRPSGDQLALYQEMATAYAEGRWDGEKESWPGAFEEAAWAPLTVDHHRCVGAKCADYDACCFYKAREKLHASDCIVANHDLVLADLALGGGAILPRPEDTIYVFDEAHHLPDKAQDHFTEQASIKATERMLGDLASAAEQFKRRATGGLVRDCDKVRDVCETLKKDVSVAWQVLLPLCSDTGSHVSGSQPGVVADRAHHERADTGHTDKFFRFVNGVVPEGVVAVAGNLKVQFSLLTGSVQAICDALENMVEGKRLDLSSGEAQRWQPIFSQFLNRAQSQIGLWAAYARADEEKEMPRARWLTLLNGEGEGDIRVSCCPIVAAPMLSGLLWQRCFGAVLTSATLAALGRFDRFSMRSGVPRDSVFSRQPSPFNYQNAATLQVPRMPCDPGDTLAHTQAVVEAIPKCLSDGRAALILFSSRQQMSDVYEGLPEHWRERTLMQGDMSKRLILEKHKSRVDQGKHSVIFGLASFAEGVDLPGTYCEHVIVAKLPFSVPGNPLEAALAEWLTLNGHNPFMEMSLPDASLRLVQAVGRLLRSVEDRGVVTILDRRLLNRRYGRLLIDSLPRFRRVLGGALA